MKCGNTVTAVEHDGNFMKVTDYVEVDDNFQRQGNASIDFYVGNLAPDANNDRERKDALHFYNVLDREDALIKCPAKSIISKVIK